MAASSAHFGEKDRASCDIAGIKVPAWLACTLFYFVLTRAVLTAIGFAAYSWIRHMRLDWTSGWLRIWNVWDSGNYIGIAQYGYFVPLDRTQMANYAFFPLYPLLMRLLDVAFGDPALSGFIISNACLLIACFFLYRLARLDSDERTAIRSVKYLFLFPTAFILSGILTESLFLALSLACIYSAKKYNWALAGALGFFTSLTRPYGVIIVMPVLYEYLRSKGFKLSALRADALSLLLIPAGISLFILYVYSITGDPLAFIRVQAAWGGHVVNPALELLYRIFGRDVSPEVLFGGCFTLAALAILAVSCKKVGFSLWAYGLLLILIPLSTPSSAWSMARYILVAFPLFIVFAKLGENKVADGVMTVCMAVMQGVLMALWTTWSFYVI